MMKNLFNLKIPSLVGVFLLLLGVGATSFLVDRGVIFEGGAAPQKTPTNIAITNVFPTGFTVMYTTTESVSGSLTYGTDKNGSSVALDDRDQQTGRTSESTVHFITVHNLTPNTTYYFSILSGGEVFKNETEPYEVKTAAELSGSPPALQPATGTVKIPDGTVQKDLLVLLSSETLEPRAALIKTDGSYTIPLSGLRTKDLSAYAQITDGTTAQLLILNHDTSSQATVRVKQTNPVPLILFGQSYDFTLSTEPLTANNSASNSAQQSFPQVSPNPAGSAISIASPNEAEKFSDQRPIFSGTALPNAQIEVTIHSDQELKETILAGADGSWQFRPRSALDAGEHKLTIKTRDVSGIVREITRSFTVYAQGSTGFIEPSVSPPNTPTPTLTDASTPTPTPTPTEAQATAPPTSGPTLPPTIVVTQTTEPTEPPPIAGSTEVIIGGILGAGTLLMGLLLFFLTKGSSL